MNILILLSAVFISIDALQTAERHFGCPRGTNACIYPIDTANLQCETFFDFQVAVHIPTNQTIRANWRHAMDIKLTLPSGEVHTPESVFKKTPELRNWTLEAFENQADETPEGFSSYAVMYRNVKFTTQYGKGPVKVSVRARGRTTEATWVVRKPTKRRAKNVVLFVGDGMALPMMAAARLVSRGMEHGKYKDLLHIEKMPYFGLQNPSGVDSIITDSANSATAMNTGHKSSVKAIGVYADSGIDDFGHPKQETLAEHIKRRFGMSVGVVSTAEVQDATPAAVWAHVRLRAEKAAITDQALNGCLDCVLAVQPDVLMGGGGKYFLPEDSVDGSDMYRKYEEAGYTVTHTRDEMLAAASENGTKKLLTVAHRGNMEVWLDRNVYKENMNVTENSPRGDGVAPTEQPNLDEMVMSAIKVLAKNENGFYLMVEAASVDKSAHVLDVPRTISDVIEMDNTVGKVIQWAKENGDDTLVLATADHGHGFDVFGTVDTKLWDGAVQATERKPVSDVEHMCSAVTDIAGKVFGIEIEPVTGMKIREANQARRSSIGVFQVAGYPDYVDSTGDGFPDSWDVRTTLAAGMNNYPDHTEDYKVSTSVKQSSVRTATGFLNNPLDDPNGIFLTGNLHPLISVDVHTLQDVGLFGYGPGSEVVGGIVDNTEIFHIMASALGFGTDGEIDRMQHVSGDVVRCVNSGNWCHCDSVDGRYSCACKHKSPESFVRPSMKMCTVRDGKATPT